ncbi:hypothetical protein AYM40_08195 [Paraburkholderia phytofirmans OLGA172]|uniref:Uncharacterized protein n=1 Tax=Paraburkholderia phytofirmans OLGA172 TaxID=1417228 RepID=A0A167VWX7_9BURK|nr:hypothetical protein [Paraburkholderia phytofirmans]ANB72343.1 hypothetical protein AYM40_08195 [Paraburkholderia phytofirmans OLGA172]
MTKQKHQAPHPKEAAQPVKSAESAESAKSAKSAESRLDEALDESFPASDPIAVDVAEPHHAPADEAPSAGKKRH